ncbi:MAG: helix-turn-helix domain-containing protein [Lachnospiraceae bacterium]
MEMKIGAKLTELRKNKGLTQNQLAEMLGISAPAVSKWENDSSYPDITLLCPLARALDTNVDTLLQFEETLTEEEIQEKLNLLIESAFQKGHEYGEEMLNELLYKYPNSYALKFNAAIAFDTFRMFFPTAGEELQEKWKARKKGLLTELYSSGPSAYRQQAALNLAVMAIHDDELARGEQLLKELPEHAVDATTAWVQLYTKKKEPEEALKITQKRLFTLIRQVQFCLTSLMSSELGGSNEQTLEICRIYKTIDCLFGLGGLYDGLFLDIYLRMGRCDDAAACFVRYVDAMTGNLTLPKKELFSPGLDIKEQKPVVTKELKKMLLRGLEDETFKPLLSYPECQEAIEKLKSEND